MRKRTSNKTLLIGGVAALAAHRYAKVVRHHARAGRTGGLGHVEGLLLAVDDADLAVLGLGLVDLLVLVGDHDAVGGDADAFGIGRDRDGMVGAGELHDSAPLLVIST